MNPLAGLGSNIDANTLVASLMEVERAPIRALTAKTAKFQANLSAFGVTKGVLSTLQTASRALSDAMSSIPATVTNSMPGVAAATVQSGATPAVYGLSVQSLATAHRIYTSAFTAADSIVGSGAIAIDRGSFDGTTFTANVDIPAVTITIPANTTLTGMRDAINNAKAGVTASVVNDGSGFRLVIGANDTGAAQGMRIRTTDDDGNNTDAAGLSLLAFDPEIAAGSAGRNMTEARVGRDAVFEVDGLPMTRPSNDVSDAVGGITFKLASVGSTNVAVTRDTAAMRTTLDELVKSYNTASGTMKSQSSYDAAARSGGPLNGESSIRGVQAQLRRTVTSNYGVDGDTYRNLSSLGITVQSNGTLSVNSAKYDAAVAANPAAASSMMGSFARALTSSLDSALSSSGTLTARTDGIQSNIQRIADQQTRLEDRMSSIEARYRTQFAALDQLMTSMNATGSFLTSQLNNSNK